jgi:hypothetical protein
MKYIGIIAIHAITFSNIWHMITIIVVPLDHNQDDSVKPQAPLPK